MAMGGVVVKAGGGGALVVVGMSVPKKWVRVTFNPPTKSLQNTNNLSFLSSSSSSSLLSKTNNQNKNRDGISWRTNLGLSISPLFPWRLHKCRSLSSSSEDRQQFSSSSSPSSSDSGEMGSESHHPSHRKFLTLPTVLTLGRVAAVPLLIATFYVESWWGTTATTSIFIAAAITDWLDGYLARKMKLGSAFGAFLDPVADKLMVAATLVLLCTKPMDTGVLGEVPWLLTVPAIAIIGREITMSAVREWAASQNTKLLEAVAVNNLGKWKTATQMTALTILVATRDSSLGGPGFLVASGVMLLYLSAGLAVWSLVVYMRKIWRVLMK